MVIYIQYKFYIIPSIGYLVTAEDEKTDRQRQTYINNTYKHMVDWLET